MYKVLQFLAKKSVFLVGVALAILANPTIYVVLGSTIFFTTSGNTSSVGYSTDSQFIQTMISVSIFGFFVALISRVSAWILAFRKIKSNKA